MGAGYAPEEFAAFDVSLKERASRLDEAVPLIQRLWTEDKVTHAGRHYRVTNASVYPRPVQRPRPPIWFGGWVDPAVRRAGRLGEAWLGGPSAKLDEVAACVRLYREARKEAGRDPSAGEVALMRYVFVAESVERARALAGAAFIRAFEDTYFRWPHPIVKRPAGDLTIERLAADRIVLGDPATCIRQIERFQKELALGHPCSASAPGTPRGRGGPLENLPTRKSRPPRLSGRWSASEPTDCGCAVPRSGWSRTRPSRCGTPRAPAAL